jgi:hypothetical protein
MDEIFESELDSMRNVFYALRELSHDESVRLSELRNSSDLLPPELIEDCTKVATDFAAIHFNGPEVASVEFVKGFSAVFDLDENGNIIIVPNKFLKFIVMDSNGREAEMSIVAETKELSHIIMQHYYIIPGYNYESNAPGFG